MFHECTRLQEHPSGKLFYLYNANLTAKSMIFAKIHDCRISV